MILRRNGIHLETTPATQYATIYDTETGNPIATVQRARAYAAKGTPNWRMYDLAGIEIGNGFTRASDALSMMVRIRRELFA